MCGVRIGWSTNENEAVLLCPQAHNNLLPGSVSSQVDYYTSEVTAVVSMTLTAADIQGVDLCEPLALFGIAMQKVPGKHSRQQPSAGSHSSQTHYAISLSYLDHLEIGRRSAQILARVVVTTRYVCPGLPRRSRTYLNRFSLFACRR